jgi:hypothetical protein
MSPEDIERLASIITDNLTDRLAENVIPGTIPADISQKWLKWTAGRPYKMMFTYPLGGGGLIIEIDLLPTGSLSLQMKEMSGNIFWKGVLTPV